ncbi:hypothetical protein [Pseudomonas aeruginosa]|uniref:hypothetical protein n=1 Tax=Pseudomonas aeruginosa TaxID=287 RepID=UPI00157A4865|nr:hypothetical protein [Pseudomonas aeruginosa]
MSSTQHQLIEQCATRLRGIVEALDNIHDTSPQRWSTDLDDVHSSAESLLAMIKDQAPPSEDQLIAAGLSYPLAKEDAVKLWYAGFRSEVVTVLEAWEAIGHDTGINPDKEELLESLRNMAAICNAHGNDMPAQSAIDQRQVIADAITGALAFGAQASQPPAADHWLRPFYDIGRAEGQRTQDLAMLVRMLASSLKRHAPESNLVARATNYLAAKGLAGAALAQHSPAQAEQAEAERPEAVAWQYRVTAGPQTGWSLWHPGKGEEFERSYTVERRPLMTVAQHERIVGELRAVIAQLRQHKNDYMDSGQETYRALQNEIREREAEIARLDGLVSGRTAERDAALARVAEMEKQEPVATVARVPGEDWNGLHFYRDLQGIPSGIKLYAAPVALAQQLHDLDKQCRDDVARALGLRPNQERGFAWSYLLASIKSCVKASEDSAQAQHSVPGDIMRDAQRYRWLRDQQFYFSFSTENSDAGISSCTAGMSSRFKNLSWVDAAIDSAIAAAPGKEGNDD